MTEQQFKLRWLLHYIHPDLFKLPLVSGEEVSVTFVMRRNQWLDPPDPYDGTYVRTMFRIYDGDTIVYQTTDTDGEYTATVTLMTNKVYKYVEMRSDAQCFLKDDFTFSVTSATTEITVMHEIKYYMLKPCIAEHSFNTVNLAADLGDEIVSVVSNGRVGVEIYWHNKDGTDALIGKYFPAHTPGIYPNVYQQHQYKLSSFIRHNNNEYYPQTLALPYNAWIVTADGGTPAESRHVYKSEWGTVESNPPARRYVHGQKIVNAFFQYDYSPGLGVTIGTEWYGYDYKDWQNWGIEHPETPERIGILQAKVIAYGKTSESAAVALSQGLTALNQSLSADGASGVDITSQANTTGTFSDVSTMTKIPLSAQTDTPLTVIRPEVLSSPTTPINSADVTLAAYTDGMTYADYVDITSNQGNIREFTPDRVKMFGGEYEYNPNYT